MAELVTLTEDGPLGKSGDQVWVDDQQDAQPKKTAAKKAAPRNDK